MPFRMSLDMEMTLANVTQRIFDLHNERYGTTFELEEQTDWEWVGRVMEYDRFMELGDEVWTEHTDSIEPIGPLSRVPFDIPGVGTLAINRLGRIGTIDIVTARQGVEKSMRNWLDGVGISEYDELYSIPNTETKADLDYDVFVDDKPGLVDRISREQTLYLVKQPYNAHKREGELPDNVIPVDHVEDVYLNIPLV